MLNNLTGHQYAFPQYTSFFAGFPQYTFPWYPGEPRRPALLQYPLVQAQYGQECHAFPALRTSIPGSCRNRPDVREILLSRGRLLSCLPYPGHLPSSAGWGSPSPGWRDPRRKHQTTVVPVYHDDCPDQAGGHAPGGLVDVFQLVVLIRKLDFKRL